MNTLMVKVIRPFHEHRTPCPPRGTIGEWHDIDGKFCRVRFPLPMIDQDGDTWWSQGQDDEWMKLKFLPEELELHE